MFDSAAFQVIALLAIFVQVYLLFLALFGPGLRYKIAKTPSIPPGSDDFLRLLEALADAKIHRQTCVSVLTDGENFYEAQLRAIDGARRSVNLEAYIFQRGEVTRRFLAALTGRARAAVPVNLVVDAIGSFGTPESYFKELRAAGGRVEWYHPLNWYTWPRVNNRTHRELLIIDGETGFIGGAGFADHWLTGRKRHPRWRDTMFLVEGDAVSGLQSAFAENWLEASGEILAGIDYFPFCQADCGYPVMIVDSTPSAGGSTRARILFQTLLAAARETIHITTPYFLPDRGVRDELIRALRERRVEVTIVTPGAHSDHMLTRTASRRLYGDLLEAGARIFEYAPSMLHTKSLTVDGIWSVVGSTNFDPRSFGLNDEVNLAAFDRRLAARIEEDFQTDVARSAEVTHEAWRRRPLHERAHEYLGWLLERQQ